MPAQLLIHPFEDLWHPWVLAWVVLCQVAYLLATGPWRRAFRWGPPVPGYQKLLFSLALWTVYLSEGTPLHILSETYLFSAHMLQHVLLTMVFPPLLLLGTPAWMIRPLLTPRPVAFVWRFLVKPAPALLLFNLIYSLWHMPVAYQATLYLHWFHMVQHAILVFTAILTWWIICSPLKEFPRASEGLQMLFIFLSGVAQIAVFAVITFADSVMYHFYEQAPRVWPFLTPHVDQQMAGVIMKVGGMATYILAWAIIFFRWAAREELGAQGRPREHQA
ncbi:MAG TPA: cytochrome c oxidase assembly protein [Symbiobacteriaceae bacterium]|nr:cytochrome c oxidase assembly protein [Symbiobacteriaceae bacterium]